MQHNLADFQADVTSAAQNTGVRNLNAGVVKDNPPGVAGQGSSAQKINLRASWRILGS
jgi:hypothetical protein